MRITVCIGSGCHLKGAREVVERLEERIRQCGCGGEVELTGAFCMGHCRGGVSVRVDGVYHSISPDGTDAFFDACVLPAMNRGRGGEEPCPKC